jgi:hypothetical protein
MLALPAPPRPLIRNPAECLAYRRPELSRVPPLPAADGVPTQRVAVQGEGFWRRVISFHQRLQLQQKRPPMARKPGKVVKEPIPAQQVGADTIIKKRNSQGAMATMPPPTVCELPSA